MASLLARLLAAIRPQRAALTVDGRGVDGPDQFAAGSVGSGYPSPPDYDLRTAMSALAGFPWVWACVDAIAADITSLPFYVERPTADGWEPVEHPEFERLMASPVPSDRLPGLLMQRQVVVDYLLTRNVWLWLDEPKSPNILRRIHPDDSTPLLDGMGLPVAYDVGHVSVERVPQERMIHIRGVSWDSDAADQAHGTSPIQVLSRLLSAEQSIMQSIQRTSKLTRPDGVLSPPDGQTWSPKQAKDYSTWLHEWLTGKGGILLLPEAAKLTPLGWAPKDMEYIAGLQRVTAATLAVFRVPPTRVGIQAANYATAQQEALLYWEARQAEAVVIADGWTRLARRWPGFEDCRVCYDFSGVDAFQQARTSRISRATQHILNGMEPARAYEVEGLEYEAAAMTEAEPAAAPAEAPAPAPDRSARHLRAALEALDAASTRGAMTEAEVADVRTTVARALALRVAQ